MSTSTPSFRTQMGGFNKKDVTGYISRLSHEYDEVLAEKDAEINALKKRLADTEEAMKEVGQSQSEAAKDELDKANSIITAQNERLETADKKVAELEAKVAELNAKLDKYVDIDSKCSRYESMTTRMGEIFMEASADADRIRNDAKNAADALVAKTDAECKARKTLIESSLNELAESRKAEILRLFDEAHEDIVSILAVFGSKSAELSKVSVDQSVAVAGGDNADGE